MEGALWYVTGEEDVELGTGLRLTLSLEATGALTLGSVDVVELDRLEEVGGGWWCLEGRVRSIVFSSFLSRHCQGSRLALWNPFWTGLGV